MKQIEPQAFSVDWNVNPTDGFRTCEETGPMTRGQQYVLLLGRWDGERLIFRMTAQAWAIMNVAAHIACSIGVPMPEIGRLREWMRQFYSQHKYSDECRGNRWVELMERVPGKYIDEVMGPYE